MGISGFRSQLQPCPARTAALISSFVTDGVRNLLRHRRAKGVDAGNANQAEYGNSCAAHASPPLTAASENSAEGSASLRQGIYWPINVIHFGDDPSADREKIVNPYIRRERRRY
jgi:hypothetical protein